MRPLRVLRPVASAVAAASDMVTRSSAAWVEMKPLIGMRSIWRRPSAPTAASRPAARWASPMPSPIASTTPRTGAAGTSGWRATRGLEALRMRRAWRDGTRYSTRGRESASASSAPTAAPTAAAAKVRERIDAPRPGLGAAALLRRRRREIGGQPGPPRPGRAILENAVDHRPARAAHDARVPQPARLADRAVLIGGAFARAGRSGPAGVVLGLVAVADEAGAGWQDDRQEAAARGLGGDRSEPRERGAGRFGELRQGRRQGTRVSARLDLARHPAGP